MIQQMVPSQHQSLTIQHLKILIMVVFPVKFWENTLCFAMSTHFHNTIRSPIHMSRTIAHEVDYLHKFPRTTSCHLLQKIHTHRSYFQIVTRNPTTSDWKLVIIHEKTRRRHLFQALDGCRCFASCWFLFRTVAPTCR